MVQNSRSGIPDLAQFGSSMNQVQISGPNKNTAKSEYKLEPNLIKSQLYAALLIQGDFFHWYPPQKFQEQKS